MAKGFGRVVGLAVTWAFIWALPAFPIEGLSNLGIDFSFTRAVDMWPQTLGIPGLIGGVFFALMLGIAGRLSEFERLAAGRLAAWGGATGLLVCGFLVLVLGAPERQSLLALGLGVTTVSGAVAAPLSAWVFRFIERKRGRAEAHG